MKVARVGRVLAQNFAKGKRYADPRMATEVHKALESVTFLDGDKARYFKEAELSGESIVVMGEVHFRKRKLSFDVWECVQN